MAEKKNRIDTDALFSTMIGKQEMEQQDKPKTSTAMDILKPGRKRRQANKQVSIYLPPDLDRELSVQGAMKDKDTDKSAIARTGIEIALALSPETYLKLKDKASTTGKGVGEIVREVLEKSF